MAPRTTISSIIDRLFFFDLNKDGKVAYTSPCEKAIGEKMIGEVPNRGMVGYRSDVFEAADVKKTGFATRAEVASLIIKGFAKTRATSLTAKEFARFEKQYGALGRREISVGELNATLKECTNPTSKK